MADRNFRIRLEPMEPRALLSHFDLGGTPDVAPMGRSQGSALVGSIQGTETISANGYQLDGTGTVTPLGDVIVIGSFGGGQGALNDKGTLTFSNSQGSLTLSLKTRGYFPLRSQNAEEIRVTVQTLSASGSYADFRVQGTINFMNHILISHEGEHPPVPFTAQIDLKAMKVGHR